MTQQQGLKQFHFNFCFCVTIFFFLSRALEVLKPLTTTDNEGSKTSSANTSFGEHESVSGDESLINSDIKSPISIVHEMALKRKLTVAFEVQSEKGPPHMKVYTTLCKVGTIVVSFFFKTLFSF